MKGSLFVACLALFLGFAPREPFGGAARLHAATARALVSSGTLDVAAEGALPGTVVQRGRRYATVGVLPSLALVPVEALLSAAAGRAWSERAATEAEAATAALCAALLCVVFFGASRRLGARASTALLMTVVLATATTIFVYARVPDGSVLAALLLLVAVEQARRALSVGSALALGAAAGGLALVDVTLVPAALTVAAFALVASRSPLRTRLALVAPLVLALVAAAAHARAVGAGPEPAGDFAEGIYGLLISTGKSVFAYSPPIFAALWVLAWWWRVRQNDALLVVLVAAAVLLPAARLEAWHGDPAWGPRRLVVLVPLLLTPAAAWLDAQRPRFTVAARTALAALLAAGVVVQLLGAAFPPETFLRFAVEVKNDTGASGWFGAAPDECHFIPQFSPLGGHAWLLSHLLRHDRALDVNPPWKLLVPTTPKLDPLWPRVRLDWWGLGWSRAWTAGWLALLTALALAGVMGIRRRL